jgi:NADPH-dependent 2,4-dienoyl-CoA reductase/sulfur reductase-like enzyme
LRAGGFDGNLTIVGDEPEPPYDRPPLSKQVLAGTWDTERIWLRPTTSADAADPLAALEADWRLGQAATGLDVAGRTVELADATQLRFDGLVIATGARPRRLPAQPELAGVHTLRTLGDCLALRADLDAGPGRVVVVGAGFIGAEVAATARGKGLEVTVLEALPVPLVRALGEAMGAVCAELHRDNGVDLRVGAAVAAFDGGDRIERVLLADGSVIDADVVVVGVGVTPNTEWLEGSGLRVRDGVVCDETCLAGPGIVAAGDVARWPHALFGGELRVEHWENAGVQAEHAAYRLLAGPAAGPFAPVPWFWSDQYDRKIQLSGWATPSDEVIVVDGSTDDRKFVALFGHQGRLVGVLGMNSPRQVMTYGRLVGERTSLADAVASAG